MEMPIVNSVPETPVKRGRGRPKGSKNKPNVTAVDNPAVTAMEETPRRGRGRPKGSRNKATIMFGHVDKDQLPAAEPKPEKPKQVYEAKIPRKGSIGGQQGLTGKYIANFTGKNYADALEQAYAWAKRRNITLLDYFEQEAFGGTSVLVSYDL